MPARHFACCVLVVVCCQSVAGDSAWSEEERRHWAFQKLARPALPRLKHVDQARTPIDAFVLAELEKKGLRLSAEADRHTLIRRVAFDLTGLPPTLDAVAAFLEDTSVTAYEKMVDSLLASPHFGERWGRHWLDGAGYVDVMGTDNDAGIITLAQNKWRYRDYVVAAFNADMRFDDFLVEQLAGDELVDWRQAPAFTDDIRRKLIATGFLRTAADDTDARELNTPDTRFGILHRTLEVAAGNLMGLTFTCARCHDHKYEPISQVDYYRLQSLFQPAFNPHTWLQPTQRQLADISPSQKAALVKKHAEAKTKMPALNSLHVVYDVGQPPVTQLLKRGNYLTPGKEVKPGFVSVLEPPATTPLKSAAQGDTSGRRLALAHWLTRPDTPAASLVLRVRVNRIWQQLFGQGLVATSDNIGRSGAKPTHPELLDWLAGEFQRRDLRLKPLLKLILTSAVYRQASQADTTTAQKIDPDNRLLWRMRLRRLESEAIRDSILAVSGKLDRTLGGPPIAIESLPDGRVDIVAKGLPTSTSAWRRSLYLTQRRNYHPTLLNVFDQPNLTTNCTGRPASAVVLQTLTMLNDRFVRDHAGFLAERVQAKVAGGEAKELIDAAFKTVLGRPSSASEMTLGLDFLGKQVQSGQTRQQAMVHLCHMLLNTSEFLYVP